MGDFVLYKMPDLLAVETGFQSHDLVIHKVPVCTESDNSVACFAIRQGIEASVAVRASW